MARAPETSQEQSFSEPGSPETRAVLTDEIVRAVRAGYELSLQEIQRTLAEDLARQVDAMLGGRLAGMTDRLAMLGTEVKTHSAHIEEVVAQINSEQAGESHRSPVRLHSLENELKAALTRVSNEQRSNADAFARELATLGNDLRKHSGEVTAALGQVKDQQKANLDTLARQLNDQANAADVLATTRFNATAQALQNVTTNVSSIAETVDALKQAAASSATSGTAGGIAKSGPSPTEEQIQALTKAAEDAEEELKKATDPVLIARLKAVRDRAFAFIAALKQMP
jgi:hypothetical protein